MRQKAPTASFGCYHYLRIFIDYDVPQPSCVYTVEVAYRSILRYCNFAAPSLAADEQQQTNVTLP
jgi:hypothetical protein